MGTVGVDVIAYANWRLQATVLETAPPEVGTILRNFGSDSSAALVRYYAAESDRFFLERWETVAIALVVLLVPAMFIAADRRLIPTIMAAFMLALALFQYFSVNPELAYRTRQVDFPPGRGNPVLEDQARGITKMYLATDAAQVSLGILLSLYVMAYKSRRRTKSRRITTNESGMRELGVDKV